jgi:Secretion system C-terminal sorting domain
MKTLFLTTLFLITLFLTQSYAQTQFQVAIGSSNCDDEGDAVQTTDGGYAICGTTQNDMYIVKLDSTGTLQWTRKVGGADFDNANSIIQTADGAYILAGETTSFGVVGFDMYIVKLSSNGSFLWNKTIGGISHDYANSIIQTADGGYIAAGESYSYGGGWCEVYIVKLSSNGSFLWNKTIGVNGINYFAFSIIQTADGGFIVLGRTNPIGTGQADIVIFKLGTNATLQWSKYLGGLYDDYAGSIIQTTDGGYAVTGYTYLGGNYNIYAAKLDSGGNIQWSKNYYNSAEGKGSSIIQTSDGGYVMGCGPQIFQYQGCLIKLNSGGNIQWSKTLLCEGPRVIKTSDGGYAASGTTHLVGAGCTDFFIVKLDADWNTCQNIGQPSFTSVNAGTSTSFFPTVNSPTPEVTTPTSQTGTGGVVTNICTTVGETNNGSGIPNDYYLYQNYPNPFNPSTTIKFSLPKSSFVRLTVYDVTGKAVQTLVNEMLEAANYEKTFDASGLSSGIYFYKIEAEGFSEVKKMVLVE